MNLLQQALKKYSVTEEEDGLVEPDPQIEPDPEPENINNGSILKQALEQYPAGAQSQPPVAVETIVETEDGSPQLVGQQNDIVNLNTILDEYGRDLIKEDFLEDDRLMEVVFQSLEARNKPSSLIGGAYKGLSSVAGADSGGSIFGSRDYRKMEREEAFETWQNYQRSFAGGQSITTANEIAYGMSADSLTKNKLGAGYHLFDSMGNAFTGDGSWSEMGDAIGDYTRAGLYDPATFLSFGLGKIVTFGATKASSVAARSLLIKGYQTYLKQGMTKTAARAAVGKAAAKAAPVTVADALIQVGTDIGYQNQLIETGVQDKYSVGQTAMAMGGAAFIPAMFLGTAAFKELRKSKALKKVYLGYEKLDADILDIGFDKAKELLKERVDVKSINVNMQKNFELKKERNSKQFLNWEIIKKKAAAGITERGEEYTETKPISQFMTRFMFGEPIENKSGFRKAIVDAGWVAHPSMLEKNTTTGIYAEAIQDYLSDSSAKAAIEAWEKSTGKKLGIGYTAKAISDNYAKSVSDAGGTLWISSQLSRMDKAGAKADATLMDMVKGAQMDETESLSTIDSLMGKKGKKKKKAKPTTRQERNAFGLSIYKRLLTSHLSTTGANLKGFGVLNLLNSAGDFATAAINISQSGVYKAIGESDKAARYKNRAMGSALGALRRGVSVLSPEVEYGYALKVLELSPESRNKLFRDIAGDGGVQDSLAHHNIDPNNKIAKGMDAVTKGAQTVTLVRMQDELTKTWAFGNNVNQQIMREYGVAPEVFFSRADAALEMSSVKFKTDVLEKATYRTLRETASVNWSTLDKQTNNTMREIATGIETLTNKTKLGYLVPFGSFLNTTLATVGDLTGINAMRVGMKKLNQTLGVKYPNLFKLETETDYITQEGSELLGKTIAGWAIVGGSTFAAGGAVDRIREGLAWNQERNNDGSLEDRTYDWPESTIRLGAQMLAHASNGNPNPETWKWSEVPDDLYKEMGMQLGGQSVRDLKDFEKSLWQWWESVGEAYKGNEEFIPMVGEVAISVVAPPMMRLAQGFTRPFDPINFTVGLVRDGNMTPDLKQGPESYAKGFRYVNHIFDMIISGDGSLGVEKRATTTRGYDQLVDPGKQILGVRGSREPNRIESMLNASGMAHWKAVQFAAPPQVKNYMNGVAEQYMDKAAIKQLKKYPNFFKMSTKQKAEITRNAVQEAKERVQDRMKTGKLPKTLDMLRIIAGGNNSKVKEIMEFLGIEGKIDDVIGTEDALGTLNKIKYYYDNYDSVFSSIKD
tara:strand:+ start:1433 stop:5233 length:3801 start_codon:yes stop_codon:yes gene_type:complete